MTGRLNSVMFSDVELSKSDSTQNCTQHPFKRLKLSVENDNPEMLPLSRPRSVSDQTTEIPDDGNWLKRSDVETLAPVEIKRRETSAKHKFNWEHYTNRWCSKHGLPIRNLKILNGLSFLLTGHLPSLYRRSAEILIPRYGGCVVDDTNHGTPPDYALVGKGGSQRKFQKIQSLAIKATNEEEFISLLKGMLTTDCVGTTAPIGLNLHSGHDSRDNSLGSSTSSLSMDRNLHTVEERERFKMLEVARRALEGVDVIFEAGLESLSDAELHDCLNVLCKYSVDASRRFKPSLLEYLRLHGIGRGLTTKYHAAFTEGEQRGFDMDSYSGKDESPFAIWYGGKHLAEESTQDDQGTLQPIFNLDDDKDNFKMHESLSTDSEESSLIAKSSVTNLQPLRSRMASESAGDNVLAHSTPLTHKEILPEDDQSEFFCRQCRRGPAICMHTHSLIASIVKDLQNKSMITKLFALYVLEQWDSTRQDAFGLDQWERKPHTRQQRVLLRGDWVLLLRKYVEREKAGLLQEEYKPIEEILQESISKFKLRAEAITIGRVTTINNLESIDSQSQVRNTRSKRKPRDSDIEDELEQLDSLSLSSSRDSENSLLQTTPNSLNGLLEDASRDSLMELVQQLVPRASNVLIARILKSICYEDETAKTLIEDHFYDHIKGFKNPTNNEKPSTLRTIPKSANSNFIDQIAEPEELRKPDTVRCPKCGQNFSPSTLDRGDECSFHSGTMVWNSNQRPVRKPERVVDALTRATHFTCCEGMGDSQGCKRGKHVLPLHHEPDEAGKSPSCQSSPSNPTECVLATKIDIHDGYSNTTPLDLFEPSADLDDSNDFPSKQSSSVHDNEFLSVPDFCPDFPSQISKQDSMALVRLVDDIITGRSFPSSQDTNSHLLCPAELGLSDQLRWDSSFFLHRKKKLFKACFDAHQAGNHFNYTAYCNMENGNKQTSRAFFYAFERAGMLERANFEQFLSQSPMTTTRETPLQVSPSDILRTFGTASGDSGMKPLSGTVEYYSRLHNQASTSTNLSLVRTPSWSRRVSQHRLTGSPSIHSLSQSEQAYMQQMERPIPTSSRSSS